MFRVPTPCGHKFSVSTFNPNSVYLGAQRLTEIINDIYTEVRASHPDIPALPARQIIATGEQPADCEQFVVAFSEIEKGLLEGDYASTCNPPLIVTYKIQVVRCIPTPDSRGNPAAPSVVNGMSLIAAIDANLLMEAIPCLSLWEGLNAEGSVEVGEPQGGMQSVTLTLRTLLGV